MKRSFKIGLTCAIVTCAALFGIANVPKQQSNQTSSLTLANVEALTAVEDNFIKACNDICVDSEKDVCSKNTAFGFPINCWNMREK